MLQLWTDLMTFEHVCEGSYEGSSVKVLVKAKANYKMKIDIYLFK